MLVEECLPGDRFKYNLVCGIKTLQTLSPVYGGVDVDFSFYFTSLGNYVPAIGQNAYGFDENNLALPWFSPQFGGLDYNSSTTPVTVARTAFSSRVPFFEEVSSSFGSPTWKYYYPSESSGTIPDDSRIALVKPTSLWDYLGYGSGFCFFGYCPTSTGGRPSSDDSNAPSSSLPFLAYWDIIRNYIANPQFERIPVYGIGVPDSSYRSDFLNTSVSLKSLDDFFSNSYKLQSTDPSKYDTFDAHLDTMSIWKYSLYYGESTTGFGYDTSVCYTFAPPEIYTPMSGLALCPYGSDYLTTVLNSDKVKGIVSRNVVSTQVVNGSNVFTIDTLRFANKRSRLTNLALFSGTRFDDWQRATWSIKPNSRLGIPFFIGSCKSTIAFDEILSNSNTVSRDSLSKSGLGQAAGRIDDGFSSANHYFECDTYGLFMVLMTIKPKLFYSRKSPVTSRTNLSDIYHNIYDRVGYQDVMLNEYDSSQMLNFDSFTSTSATGSLQRSDNVALGSVAAYSEYMTSVDTVHGELSPNGGTLQNWTTSFNGVFYRDGDGFWHRDLNEISFSALSHGGVQSAFRFDSYGDPYTVNSLFSETSDFAQNFIVSIRHNLFVNRNKQKNILPSL